MGVPIYIDPQYLKNGNKITMKSDIYSLGVMFWELTSGIPPFHNIPEMAIILEILNNNRKKTIDNNTPLNYPDIECLSSENTIRKDNHKNSTLANNYHENLHVTTSLSNDHTKRLNKTGMKIL
ncbi:kinase-like protein [Gigaspora margarita]|uniref:Kinase-like protein n=1 Tax=Gigaspora margarita TaxID=4874 RepID=A0A8H4ESL4_GIGMA|nr:kinase-like protein [Gigaspora margarita]